MAQTLLPFKALLGSEAAKLELEFEKLSTVPGQPTMEFELGPLPLAMLRGGVLLLDEFDTLPPAVALNLFYALQYLLETLASSAQSAPCALFAG